MIHTSKKTENVCDLIVVADYYGFESVIEQCNDFIEKHLTTNTCISIWEFSNDFNLAKIEGPGSILRSSFKRNCTLESNLD